MLAAVRRDLLTNSEICWQEVISGRLLRVRAEVEKQCWEILGIYQHTMTNRTTEETAKIMSQRRKVWQALDKTASGIPFRALLVIGGDFNASLEPRAAVVGSRVMQGAQTHEVVQERGWILDMLAKHRLTVLNSWGRREPTYEHPAGSSQIDFLITRQHVADRKGKQAGSKHEGLAAWRSAGQLPVLGSIKPSWRPWVGRMSQKPCTMRRALSDNDRQAQALRDEIKANCPGRERKLKLPVPANVDSQIEAHWKMQKRLRQIGNGVSILKLAFQAMRAAAIAQKVHKDLKRACRQRKRDQLPSGLQSIEEAAKNGDSKAFYGFARLVSPKPHLPKIKLRDKTGTMLTRAQEGELLHQYAVALFAGKPHDLPPLLPLPEDLMDSQAWKWALHKIKKDKAVPTDMAQIATWQAWSSMASERLAEISKATLCSANPYIPELWLGAQIVWLPKPGKTPSTPGNLRTVGLMGADTKALMVLLKTQAAPYSMNALESTPQFAYRQGVSTLDAITRAGNHCHEVRRLLESASTSQTAKILGAAQPTLIGGLMMSIDLAKAFDSLSHGETHASLAATGMPEYLVNVQVHIHARSISEVAHGDFRSDVEMGQGLRQGCPVAPLVYAAWTSRLCSILNSKLQSSWTDSAITIFADDKFLRWKINGAADLEQAIREVAVVLQTLGDIGMTVSHSKSEAVLVVKGSDADRVRKRFIHKRNGVDTLRRGLADGSVYIPIKTEVKYLGIMLSYGSYELRSAKHRCRLAQVAFGRLHKVFCTGAAISQQARLRVYRACVWPVVTYGLLGLGPDARALDHVCSTVATHLRKIQRLYQHGISYQSVFEKAQLHPADELLARAQQLADGSVEGGGFVRQQIWHGAQRICRNLREVVNSRGSGLRPHTQASEVACPVCGLYFGSEAGLVTHIKSQHKETHENAKVTYVKSKHSISGIPMRKFCLKLQCDWQSLEKHITMGGCLEVKAAIAKGKSIDELYDETEKAHAQCPPQPPDAMKPRLTKKVLVSDGAPVYSAQNSELSQQADSIVALKSRCALCGQVLLSGARVKPHWRKAHAAAWAQVSADAIGTCKSLSSIFRKPCQFCTSQARSSTAHSGQCAALFQVLAGRHLTRLGQQESAGQDLKAPRPRRGETTAAYKRFDLQQTPLAQACRRGAGQQSIKQATGTKSQAQEGEQQHAKHTCRGGSRSSSTGTKLGQVTIHQVLRLRQQAAAGSDTGPRSRPWTYNVRLGNPHQLCYVNAGILSLIHALRAWVRQSWRALSHFAGAALNVGVSWFSLDSWLFGVYAQVAFWSHTAEFLLSMLSERSGTCFQWEARQISHGRAEVTGRCGPIFLLEVPRVDSWTPTQAFTAWSEASSTQAVSRS